jgi:formylglycine-generating enzyme required for sulfatase activity/predicted Ser/Thr protein kinase
MPLQSGSLLHNDRYRIEQPLGKGGFSEVYLARDQSLEGYCAVKRNLNPAPEVQLQFQRETKMLFELRHAVLPRVYDYFEENQDQYLVMDFIEGENLDALVKRSGALPVEQVLGWIKQIGEALKYMHSRQPPIIHRDIKPANIILTPEGQVVLVDFGTAKTGDIELMYKSEESGVTPGFSPPEAYGTTGTDAQSDLYSLAATTYMLLTGQTPADAWDILLGKEQAPLSASQVNPKVPEGVSRALEIGMCLNRFERIHCVEYFLVLLPSKDPDKEKPEILTLDEKKLKLHYLILKDRAQSTKFHLFMPEPPPDRIFENRPVISMEPELVRIPAGEFLIGGDDRFHQHKLNLPGFWISKYPVTNAKFRLFLIADPLQQKPFGWKDYDYPAGKEQHPVVNVSWHDALAYCRWLSKMTGKHYSLPSEPEWEKAARGTDGRIYPWGNEWDPDYCIASEKKPDETTQVGMCSPKGDSPYGCSDMAGNILEFTRSIWGGKIDKPERYPYTQDPLQRLEREDIAAGDRVPRVARGDPSHMYKDALTKKSLKAKLGVEFNFSRSDLARCAFRFPIMPDYDSYYVGFRVIQIG